MGVFTAATIGLVYIAFVISFVIFFLLLLIRFVKAHESAAVALQMIADEYQKSSRRD